MEAYIYNTDSREVVAVIVGQSNEQIEQYAARHWDVTDGEIGLTYSPAFELSGGLIMTTSAKTIELA